MKSVNTRFVGHVFWLLKYCLFLNLALTNTLVAQQTDPEKITVTRLGHGPIIESGIHPSIGKNIQGPSLIKVPEWVTEPLGKYYLYFADHKGLYIRLAYADNLLGPWKIHEAGSLHIKDSFFAPTRPAISEARLTKLVATRIASGVRVSHDYAKELTEPHIASPDVHVDNTNQKIVMYYHGL